MSPIVSPWWFYLFGLVNNLREAAYTILIFLGAGTGVTVFIWGVLEGEKVKIPKWIVSLLVASAIIVTFVPSKEVCYQMAAASLVTPNNISIVGETAKDAIDYIVESVDKVLDEEEE